MQTSINGISSMATRQLLADMVASYQEIVLCDINIESIGGVDAAKRVQSGEAFDVVILASDAIDKLIISGHVDGLSKIDLVNSGVAVAIKSGTAHSKLPDISHENAVKQAVLDAKTIGYSTGPSGVALAKIFERWGIADKIASRVIQAPPGVSVGSLIANGEVELGFQQLSELIHVEDITIVGSLPPALQIITTFSAGVGMKSRQAAAVRELLQYFTSTSAEEIKIRQGMQNI
jgi:molybdate transport system substrate-binding protein